VIRRFESVQKRANSLFVFIAIIGAALAGFIYTNATHIQDDSRTLVEVQLPALDDLQVIDSELTELERILYEYYATQNRRLYNEDYTQTLSRLESAIYQFKPATPDKQLLLVLELNLADIVAMSKSLDVNLNGPTNWDLAREQMAEISTKRRNILPVLNQAKTLINEYVEQGYLEANTNLDIAIYVVAAYSLFITLLIFAFARYVRKYIMLGFMNERLALFAKRNPNPIISIDYDLTISYQNPATDILLTELKLSSALELLSGSLSRQLKSARENTANHPYQSKVKGRTFSYLINWLDDIQAFDIHLTEVTAEKEAQLQLEYIAYHHDISELYNGVKFQADLSELTSRQKHFWLMLIELPDYGDVMADYGLTGASDMVFHVARELKSVFELSKQTLSLNSNIYHVADASFAIIFNTAHHQNNLLDKVSYELSQHFKQAIKTANGKQLIPLKIGITEYPNVAKNESELMLQAKIALDNATEQARPIRYYSTELGDKHARLVQLNNQLKTAIEKNQLALYYQPQFSLTQDQFNGAEALIRWKTETGFISPAEFIPIAENSGMILELGHWIIKTAFTQVAIWQDSMEPGSRIAVNISPRQFIQPGFVNEIRAMLEQTGARAHRIELEITEGTIMENETYGVDVLNQLKALGLAIAIDDFGTGYSSLSYLRHFPVDKLKIDQSFIKSLERNKADQAIVLTLCQLGKNVNLKVIAEGVESREQLALLRGFDCDEIQGYFYSKPLTVEEFEYFIAQSYV